MKLKKGQRVAIGEIIEKHAHNYALWFRNPETNATPMPIPEVVSAIEGALNGKTLETPLVFKG
jgi:hypothetical protein